MKKNKPPTSCLEFPAMRDSYPTQGLQMLEEYKYICVFECKHVPVSMQHTMNTHGGVEVKLHAFLTLEPKKDKLS
jgi:hypothetical protein